MNENAFLTALRDDPADEATWLALTDWLEDQQPRRAELLRQTRTLATPPAESEDVLGRVVALLTAGVEPIVVERVNSIGMRFALVTPGRFLMGSPADEQGRSQSEHLHEVTLTRPFWLGVFSVTQGQYEAVTGHNPSHFSRGGAGKGKVRRRKTDQFPVEMVSWQDTQEFLTRLNGLPAELEAKRRNRLPTEAEWEYACRAGGISRLPFCLEAPSDVLRATDANVDGTHPTANDVGPNLERTCKVGSYRPNPLGLYDMHGNVWDWCADWYDENYFLGGPERDPPGPPSGDGRVYKGGSWLHFGYFCRAAFRSGYVPDGAVSRLGFRVALEA